MRNRRLFGALTAAVLIAGSGVVAGSPARTSMPTSTVRAALAETMELDGWPAALVAVRDERDRVKTLAAGVLELGEAKKARAGDQVRIGSSTKAVAGRPFAEELERRLLDPLWLDDTYFPEQGEEEIRGKHPHSYIPLAAPPIDYTDFDPSWAHAAGAMVSTAEDMTTFSSALAEGELLPAPLLAEMQQTIPADSIWPGAAYGLGLIAFELSCGVTAWGHGGDAPGTVSRVAATEDGRSAAVVVTKNGREAEAEQRLRDLVDTAICAL